MMKSGYQPEVDRVGLSKYGKERIEMEEGERNWEKLHIGARLRG